MTRLRGKKSLTPEVLEQCFVRHLPYEIDMFRALFLRLQSPQPDKVTRNAEIEGFITHARNLVEFFKNKPSCDFDPRHFTVNAYRPDGNFIDGGLEAKMNQQVTHLTAERTTNTAKQLGAGEFVRIHDAIEKEILRFEAGIKPEYKNKWKLAIPRSMKLDASFLAATNSITHTTSCTPMLVVHISR